jgi:hypothetical protein
MAGCDGKTECGVERDGVGHASKFLKSFTLFLLSEV